jgi:hypothetical protein
VTVRAPDRRRTGPRRSTVRSFRIRALLSVPPEPNSMSFEKEDEVVLHDKHSEYDGETGTITQVMETMFGDATYTVSFEDGQETGVPEDALDAVESEE